MGIYDNEKERFQKSVRLTTFQAQKLRHICDLFGITHQRLFTDLIEFFYMDLIDVQSGRISTSEAMRQSAQALLDDYIKLKEIKGLVPRGGYVPVKHRYSTTI